jgi:hypothetical protein
MLQLIGLHGRAGAGKDTFADFLVAERGFVKRGFADPLYEEVSSAFGVTVEWLKNRDRKELPQPELALWHCIDPDFYSLAALPLDCDYDAPRSPRQILQLWGTEYRRYGNENYWLDKMGEFVEGQKVSQVVIPDVRFDNEAGWVIARRGLVVEIQRPDLPAVNAHASEKALRAGLVSEVVVNNGSLSQLHDVAIFTTSIDWPIACA